MDAPNNTFDRTAGSRSLAAAGQRRRWADRLRSNEVIARRSGMVRLKLVAPVAAIGMLIALVCPVQHASTQTTQGGSGTPTGISIAEAEAPPGTETLAVQWVKVAAPNLGVVLAAVARPRGAGPFPTVILLHGTHGFAHEYVRLAQDLANGGDVLAVAACWFRGSAGSGTRFITPIACPDGPPMSAPVSSESLQAL